MNKISVLVMFLALALFVSTIVGTSIGASDDLDPSRDPRYWGEMKNPPPQVEPPIISMDSPMNRSYNVNKLHLNFNLSEGKTGNLTLNECVVQINQSSVFYKGDWQQTATWVDLTSIIYSVNRRHDVSIPLSNMPEGNRSVTVYVSEIGYYYNDFFHYSTFTINDSSTAYFTIDTVTPIVSIASPRNVTYQTSTVPLMFAVNDETATVKYGLDDNALVTLTDDINLTGLSVGLHLLKVYAYDGAGNVGTSETLAFNILQPTPTPSPSAPPVTLPPPPPQPAPVVIPTVIIYALAISASLIGTGVSILFWRKRKAK
jgi:hypothetical protein